MGFLKDMLNPVKTHKSVLNRTKAALHGDFKTALNPNGPLESWKPQIAIKADPSQTPNGDAATSGMYGGDPNDPAFGSFTKPFDVEEFYKYQDPGYAFRLQQGKQAVANGNSAGDGALSGAAYKDLIDYNQNSASQEYGNSFNRYQATQGSIFDRLSALATLGQNAAAGVGAQGTQLAGNAGQFLSNAGTAQGSGIVGAGNAIAGGATNAWLWNQMNKRPSGAVNGPV